MRTSLRQQNFVEKSHSCIIFIVKHFHIIRMAASLHWNIAAFPEQCNTLEDFIIILTTYEFEFYSIIHMVEEISA